MDGWLVFISLTCSVWSSKSHQFNLQCLIVKITIAVWLSLLMWVHWGRLFCVAYIWNENYLNPCWYRVTLFVLYVCEITKVYIDLRYIASYWYIASRWKRNEASPSFHLCNMYLCRDLSCVYIYYRNYVLYVDLNARQCPLKPDAAAAIVSYTICAGPGNLKDSWNIKIQSWNSQIFRTSSLETNPGILFHVIL